MTEGAGDHQKVFGKEYASEVVYSNESLYHLGDGIEPQTSGQAHCPEDQLCFVVDDNPPKTNQNRSLPEEVNVREVEAKARDLLCRKASHKALHDFLQTIPWSRLQFPHKDRSILEANKDPEQQRTPAYVVFGMYVHGGVVGVTRVTRVYPWLTRVLCEVFRHHAPNQKVSSIGISCNCQAKLHRDRFNMSDSMNTVVPLVRPKAGGEVWIEGVVSGVPESTRMCDGKEVRGHCVSLNKPQRLDPRKWHETVSWKGRPRGDDRLPAKLL